MAYNHAQAEAEWKREEHARILKMRKAGMSKEDILTMVVYDRSVFNSNRRFESHLDDSEMDIENAADCEGFGELYTVEQMKIARILTERKRKNASGIVRWTVSNTMRTIKNATYMGLIGYNKSRSNNFLEQKRVNNLDMSTYEYVQGDFPAIVSREVWERAQAIREKRTKEVFVTENQVTRSKRDSKDIWVNKLRCSCGCAFRRNKWHTKLDGKISYGYQCYNQIRYGKAAKRRNLDLDAESYCDIKMICDWKLDFMAKVLMEYLWVKKKESVLLALELIKCYYKEEQATNDSDAVGIKTRIAKANSRLLNLTAMRADGEISKDEYLVIRKPIDEEIAELQKLLENTPDEPSAPKEIDLDGIRDTLNTMIDFSGASLSHEIIDQFVYMVRPTSDISFEWYLNLNGKADVKATFTVEGRKKNCVVKLEEIEEISSLHRKDGEIMTNLIKNPSVFSYLHRQLSLTRSNFCFQAKTNYTSEAF